MNTILTILMITVMTYEMPKLPYTNNALEPVISQQTIDYHYGKHLQTYVNNLNNLVPGTEFEGKDLVTIVATAPDGAIFNNAGQVLNHTLYFLQFAPKPAQSPSGAEQADSCRVEFHITKEANGSNPVRAGLVPLLGFDVWEHAYYLDYQNRRADHVNELWSIIDWDVVGKRLK